MKAITPEEQMLVRLKAVVHLRRYLQEHKKDYLTALHHRVAPGLTWLEFDDIVRDLMNTNFCYIQQGRKGGELLVFNQEV